MWPSIVGFILLQTSSGVKERSYIPPLLSSSPKYFTLVFSFGDRNILLHNNLLLAINWNVLVCAGIVTRFETKLNYAHKERGIYVFSIIQNDQRFNFQWGENKSQASNSSSKLVITSPKRFSSFSIIPCLLFPLPSFSTLISQAVSFSSQQISVTTCILLQPYFTIHAKILFAILQRTIASPIHPLTLLFLPQPWASNCLISISVSKIIQNFI